MNGTDSLISVTSNLIRQFDYRPHRLKLMVLFLLAAAGTCVLSYLAVAPGGPIRVRGFQLTQAQTRILFGTFALLSPVGLIPLGALVFVAMYGRVDVPIPATLNKTAEQTPGWAPRERGMNENNLRRIMPKYYGMVKCIDDNVGKIVDCLRREKLLDRTIVVFTADHGDLCGEHGRLNKGVPYEGSAKIPFILYYPAKVPAGTVVNEALSCIDFLPTVLGLMDVETAGNEQGRDASALLTGKKPADWHDIAFLRGTGAVNWICAVTDRYKLVYSPKDDPWLFDLEKDPDELTNRFGDAEYRPIVRRLTTELIDYCKTYGDANGEAPKVKADMAAAAE